jgi:uncharacterized membrane protein
MRKLNILAVLVLSLLSVALVSASYNAGELSVVSVEVNGEEFEGDNLLANPSAGVDNYHGLYVEEGEKLEVEVKLRATGSVEDIRVEAEISGYEFADHEDLDAETTVFNIRGSETGSTTRTVGLDLELPRRLDQDRYLLRVRVTDKDNADMTHYVVLQVEPTRRGVDIADVYFSPGDTIKAGRSLLTTVLLENFGDKDEKDVVVEVAIPELGVRAIELVDAVNTDNHNVDFEDVPEMFLQIPANAPEGEYQVVVSVRSDRLSEVTSTHTVKVVSNELFGAQDRLVLAVGPESQTVAQGKVARYAVALTNAGASSKAYVLSATAGNWASVSLSENLVVLESGKNQVVYVDVAASRDATAGAQGVAVTIASNSEVLETVQLSATVVDGAGSVNLRNGLEVALIVLVVVLVIIGLIIGFSRLRRDEEDQEDKTYY